MAIGTVNRLAGSVTLAGNSERGATAGQAALGGFRWLATGAATASVTVAFAAAGLGNIAQSLAAAALLVFLPVAALAQSRALSEVDLRRRRLEVYASSIFALAAIGLPALWLGRGLPAQPGLWMSLPVGLEGEASGFGGLIGFAGLPVVGVLLAASGVLAVGGLALVYAFKRASATFGWRETAAVRDIIPDTPAEKTIFVLLSVAAGMFEEIVFRGFLPAFLMPWTGSYLLASLPAAAAFGLLHAYQGRHGIVRTGLLGLWLAVGVGWTGSLWPSIFAHATLDLLIGLALAPSLLGAHREPKSTE